jgi:hypothetical protein
MRRSKHQITSEEDLFVGIDLHKIRWHVTIRTVDLELFSASIPGTWEALQRVLARYAGHQMQAVYEAGLVRVFLFHLMRDLLANIARYPLFLETVSNFSLPHHYRAVLAWGTSAPQHYGIRVLRVWYAQFFGIITLPRKLVLSWRRREDPASRT